MSWNQRWIDRFSKTKMSAVAPQLSRRSLDNVTSRSTFFHNFSWFLPPLLPLQFDENGVAGAKKRQWLSIIVVVEVPLLAIFEDLVPLLENISGNNLGSILLRMNRQCCPQLPSES